MEFPVPLYNVMYNVIRLLNNDTILDLDDGEIDKFVLRTFLEDTLKYGVNFLVELGETIYIMGIKENVIHFNGEERLVVIVRPL